MTKSRELTGETDRMLGYHYPEATDAYLSGLERVDAHKSPGEFAKSKPEELQKFIFDRIDEATKRIEESRRNISYYASVCERLRDEHPDFFALLSPEDQQIINDMARRLDSDEVTADQRVAELRDYEQSKRNLEGMRYMDRYMKLSAAAGSGVLGIFGASKSLEHNHTPLAIGIGLGATALGYLSYKFLDKVTRDDIQEARDDFEGARATLVHR